MDVQYLISLIGKSERDANVVDALAALVLPTSLKRPRRGEYQVNLVAEKQGIELAFVTSESLSNVPEHALEGELFLHAVFVHATPAQGNSTALPFGLTLNLDRQAAHSLLGTPSWTNPMMNNERWVVDGIRTLLCFDDDWNCIREICFSREPE